MRTSKEFYELSWTNPGRNIPWNSSCTATYLPSLNLEWTKKEFRQIVQRIWDFGRVLWQIYPYWLFDAESFLYMYIEYMISKHILYIAF